jgi:UDP-N-acetylmuramate-alanine ligase
MKALVFMAENLTKQNISLIKNLLSDKDNEIRLYSYSLINNMERDINENIEQKKKQLLKEVSFEKRSLLLSELATLYWEMVYYGISDGETKSFMYDKVKYYANEAMQSIKYRGPLSLLLAKVNFAEKNYSKALALFIDAIQKGMDKNTINPYLAEISFELKDFKSVKQSMQDVNQHEVSMLIDPIAQEWRTS